MDKPAKDLKISELIRECQTETKQTYGYRCASIWIKRSGVHHKWATSLKTLTQDLVFCMGLELEKERYIEK